MAALRTELRFVVTELSVRSQPGGRGWMRVKGEWLPPTKAREKSLLHSRINALISRGVEGDAKRIRLVDALHSQAAAIEGKKDEFRLPAEKGAAISLGSILRMRH